uniref:Uncharacterized protein n=1 Tax=Rhizophora mucronata TaxID=61149 RepID=A0A2P2MDF1_RHIMU
MGLIFLKRIQKHPKQRISLSKLWMRNRIIHALERNCRGGARYSIRIKTQREYRESKMSLSPNGVARRYCNWRCGAPKCQPLM